MNSADEILAAHDALRADQEALYKDLHRHPGLSHQEHHTAERVAGRLQEYGSTVQTGIGGTGVVGVLANGAGPTVLLRAELDALPIREDTGAPHASTVTVTDATATRCRSPMPAAMTCTCPACSVWPGSWPITPASPTGPCSRWPDTYRAAEKAGRLGDMTTNHSPKFLPPLQPTLRTGTETLTTAALAWLAPR